MKSDGHSVMLLVHCTEGNYKIPAENHVVVHFSKEWWIEVKKQAKNISLHALIETIGGSLAGVIMGPVLLKEILKVADTAHELGSPITIYRTCESYDACQYDKFYFVDKTSRNNNFQLKPLPTAVDLKNKMISTSVNHTSIFAIGRLQSNQTTQYTLYQNSQYGFSVEYPQNWTRTDHFTNQAAVVGIGLSPNKSLEFDMAVQKNNNAFAGRTDQEILDGITKVLDNRCSKTSIGSTGYTCSQILYKTAIAPYDASHQAYVVGQGWTKTLKDGTASKWISLWTFIPIGDDLWALTLDSSSDDYSRYSNEITHIGNSFTLDPK